MPSLDDTLAALMAKPRTTMRLGTSTASLSAVSVAGGTVSVDRWIAAPAGAGEPVVLLMQDGAVVASVAAAGGQGGPDFVRRSGDTMTGPLSLSQDPAANMHAVTKQYVDKRPRWRGTLPNTTIPNVTATRLSGAPTIWVADRITVSNGVCTVQESGLYVVSAYFGLGASPGANRAFGEWVANTGSLRYFRQPIGTGDTIQGNTQLLGLGAGDTCYCQVYQASGASVTANSVVLQLVKVSEL